MKMLKKLALVSAVSMISAGAFAMEAMDDASMAATTGQDGITVKIKPPTSNFDALKGTNYFAASTVPGFAGVLSIDNVYIHDKGGLTSTGAALGDAGYTNTAGTSGAITLSGLKMAGSAPIELKIDADGGGGAGPTLNVNVKLPGVFIVRTGDIGVAASNRVVGAATTVRGVSGAPVVILDSLDLSLGGTTMNIQLANSPQGTMIAIDGAITNGLVISGLKLNDTDGAAATTSSFGAGGGSVYINSITVTDTADTSKLTLATNVDITAAGLIMTMRTGSPKTDILMADVRLGTIDTTSAATIAATPSIGDVEIVGLGMGGTQIAISGH